MMRERLLVALRNPWLTTAVGVTAMVALTAALFGFVLLPTWQGNVRYRSLWDSICSAAGLIRPVAAGTGVVQPDYPITRVALTPRMLRHPGAESIGRGATLALRCAMCHGARGLSEANAPNLAGQYAPVIYKQLRDFQSGARASAVMAPLVTGLSDQDMRDLAAYYAYLPRLPPIHPSDTNPEPRIVGSGAPMRGIAPCGACHGELSHKTGSPWLEGQPAAYLLAQMHAFATGARRNDAGEQMRNVARQMTAAEIEAASGYYGTPP
jgi:cytochrome c553